MSTPLYQRLNREKTQIYVFPSAAADNSLRIENPNYNMRIDKFALLNLPKQNTNPDKGEEKFNFSKSFHKHTPFDEEESFADQFIASLRNYVANQSIKIKESMIGENRAFYDPNDVNRIDEILFWKWLKKMNVLKLESAVGERNITPWHYDNRQNKRLEWVAGEQDSSTIVRNQSELAQNFYHEILWKEKTPANFSLLKPYTSRSFSFDNSAGTQGVWIITNTNAVTTPNLSISEGDYVRFESDIDAVDNSPLEIKTHVEWLLGLNNPFLETRESHRILEIDRFDIRGDFYYGFLIPVPEAKAGMDITVDRNNWINYNGVITMREDYDRVVQVISETSYTDNIQFSSSNQTIITAQIPAATGSTPVVLFRTTDGNNYNPSQTFPIQDIEQINNRVIDGAEVASNPINTDPQDYPGDKYSHVDDVIDGGKYVYKSEEGDRSRKTGAYYGLDYRFNKYNNGEPAAPREQDINPLTLDGLSIDFVKAHYADLVDESNEFDTFIEYNSFNRTKDPDGLPSYNFNAILWYYTLTDNNTGEQSTNVYGIQFIRHPDDDPEYPGARFPLLRKRTPGPNRSEDSYNFNMVKEFVVSQKDNITEYNPLLGYDTEFFNLYSNVMRELLKRNELIANVSQQYISANQRIQALEGIVLTEIKNEVINQRLNGLEENLRALETLGFESSDSIEFVTDLTQSPPVVRANSTDAVFARIFNIKTTDLYSSIDLSAREYNIQVPKRKNFMVNIENNDTNNNFVNGADNLTVVLERDLDYKQSVEFNVYPRHSSFDKGLSILVNKRNADNSVEQSVLVDKISLPVDRLIENIIPEYNFIEADETDGRLDVQPLFRQNEVMREQRNVAARIENMPCINYFNMRSIEIRKIPTPVLRITLDKDVSPFLPGDFISLRNLNLVVYFDTLSQTPNQIKDRFEIDEHLPIKQIIKEPNTNQTFEPFMVLDIDISASETFEQLFNAFIEVNHINMDLSTGGFNSLAPFIGYGYPTLCVYYGMKIKITRKLDGFGNDISDRYLIEKTYTSHV